MEDKDIIGKEFTVFKFDTWKQVSWYDSEDKYIGTTGVVLNVHEKYPEYVNVEIRSEYGSRLTSKHFPTHLIKEYFEAIQREEENKTVDDLLIEMKQLISRI